MEEQSNHTQDSDRERVLKVVAARRARQVESRVREKEVLARLHLELEIDLPKIANLSYPDPYPIEGALLAFLLRELETATNDSVMGNLCRVLLRAPTSRLPVQPFIEAYVRGGEWTRLNIENALQTKKWPGMGDWVVERANQTTSDHAALWHFDALAKQADPTVAEQIIRNRFWDHPGYAAQSLAKIGNEDTIEFLSQSLEELDGHELPKSTDKNVHIKKIERAIVSIRNRLAKNHFRRSGVKANRPRVSAPKKPVERPFQDARVTNVTIHWVYPALISEEVVLDLPHDTEPPLIALQKLREEIHERFTGYYSKDIDVIAIGFSLMTPDERIRRDYEFGLPGVLEKEFAATIAIGVFFENWFQKSEYEMFSFFLDKYLEALDRIIEYLRKKGKDIDEPALRADMAKFRDALTRQQG